MESIISKFKSNKKLRIITVFIIIILVMAVIFSLFFKWSRESKEIIGKCAYDIENASTDNEIETLLGKLNGFNKKTVIKQLNKDLITEINEYKNNSEYDNEFYSKLSRQLNKYNKYNLISEKTQRELPDYKYVLNEMEFSYGLNDIKSYFESLQNMGIEDQDSIDILYKIIESHQKYNEAERFYMEKTYNNALLKLEELDIYEKDVNLKNKADDLTKKVCESYRKTIKKELDSLYNNNDFTRLFQTIIIYKNIFQDEGEKLEKEYIGKCEVKLDNKINVKDYKSAYEISTILYSVDQNEDKRKWYIKCLKDYAENLIYSGKIDNARRIVERQVSDYPDDEEIKDLKIKLEMDYWKVRYYLYLKENINSNVSFKIQEVKGISAPILAIYSDNNLSFYCINGDNMISAGSIRDCIYSNDEYYYCKTYKEENTYYSDIKKEIIYQYSFDSSGSINKNNTYIHTYKFSYDKVKNEVIDESDIYTCNDNEISQSEYMSMNNEIENRIMKNFTTITEDNINEILVNDKWKELN